MTRLKTGYSFNTKDIFQNFNIKYIKTNSSVLKEHYKTREKKEMAAKVFLYAMYLIILDIIENNITFVLPSRRRSLILMKRTHGDDFRKVRKCGKFKEIDFYETNFSGYLLEFAYWTKYSERYKNIYINNDLKNKIAEYANNGKLYF